MAHPIWKPFPFLSSFFLTLFSKLALVISPPPVYLLDIVLAYGC